MDNAIMRNKYRLKINLSKCFLRSFLLDDYSMAKLLLLSGVCEDTLKKEFFSLCAKEKIQPNKSLEYFLTTVHNISNVPDVTDYHSIKIIDQGCTDW